MARRKKNPSTAITVAVGVGSALLGIAVGYAVGRSARRGQREIAGAEQWTWWIEGTVAQYTPYIRSPRGEVFALAQEVTEASAENAAEDTIRDRGGIPVQGKPVAR